MQEHIRRAHPNHYIPKLPATEESFLLMVTTPPDQRAHIPPPNQAPSRRHNGGFIQLFDQLDSKSASSDSEPQQTEISTLRMPARLQPPGVSMKPILQLQQLLLHWLNCTITA
jgi:hypothetical protein